MVGSQIGTLIPDPSFGHNLCFKYPNGSWKPILDIHIARTFQWYKFFFNAMSFDPWNSPLKIQESFGTLTPKMGVHSFTFSYIPGSMKCDSQASFLARTLASPCFGCESKATIITHLVVCLFEFWPFLLWKAITFSIIFHFLWYLMH